MVHNSDMIIWIVEVESRIKSVEINLFLFIKFIDKFLILFLVIKIVWLYNVCVCVSVCL